MPFVRGTLVAVALLTIVACSPSSGQSTTTTSLGGDGSTTTAPVTTPTPALGQIPPCLSGSQPFVESGGAGVIERLDSDADVVTGVRWSTFPDCERIVVEFAASSGAPAVAPPGVGPLFIRSAGVLRLQLDPTVTRSTVMDQVVDTPLVDHVFVVRRPTNDLFLDIHLADPAVVRVTVASSPARIVVDIQPGGDPYRGPAVRSDALVVVDPSPGSAVYPFTVNGYTLRPATAIDVTIESAGQVETYTAAVGPGGDAWGAFTVLVPDGPIGPASMVVGNQIPMSMTFD